MQHAWNQSRLLTANKIYIVSLCRKFDFPYLDFNLIHFSLLVMQKTSTHSLLLLYMLFTLSSNVMAQTHPIENPEPLSGKNILVVWGGWDGHQPQVFAKKISEWADSQGAHVLVSDSLGVYTDASLMNKQDLIIQYWTMGTITEAQSKGLIEAVKNGAGLVGCHGGIGDSFRQDTEFQYMVGGQWVSHPGGKINYKVEIARTADPVTQGVNDFHIFNTEQYYMHVDPNVKVLARTTFNGDHDSWINGATMPVVWKKQHHKGRVFYISIGHNPEDFDQPEVWTMLTRGIHWAVRSQLNNQIE